MGQVIFKGANLLDGEKPARPGMTIVVEGEHIKAVQAGDGPAPLPDDRVVDLAGKTVMPGMISCHFHAVYSNVGASPAPIGLSHPPSYLTLLAAQNVRTLLMHGFTGAVGASTAYSIDASLKAAINHGLIEGPRMMASSRDLVTTGDSQDMTAWWWELGAEAAMRVCDGPDEFRKAVREEIKRGAEIVKLYPTGGHGVPLAKDVMSVTRQELEAAVEAAHDRGKKVRGHICSKRAILASVEAGVDVIDHADLTDGECIDAYIKAGSFVVPSLYYPLRVVEDYEKRGEANRAGVRSLKEGFELMCSILPEASQAGVKLVLGDDYGTVNLPHGGYGKELELYVTHAGLSALEVLTWATRNGAELMGMGDTLGTIEAGKLADILVVDGDPSVDITVLQDLDKLLAIMKGGEFFKDSLLGVDDKDERRG